MNLQFKTRQLAAFVSAGLLALAGCSGEDGSAGAAGTSCSVTDNGNGTSTVACTDGTTATVADGVNGQSCALTTNADGTRTITCPDGGTITLPAAAALAGKVTVTDEAFAVDGADAVITFKVNLDGAYSTLFTTPAGDARSHFLDAAVGGGAGGFNRGSFPAATLVVTADETQYTVRIPGAATAIGTTPTTFMLTLSTGAEGPVATVVAHSTAGASKSTPSNQACMNCHGYTVFPGGHHDANPKGIGACVVCHVRYDRSETRLGTASTATVDGNAENTRLMGYVHGIHNSHNMADGVYSRNGSTSASSQFSIGFPGYMNNCSTCHDTDENLAYISAKPVSYQTCISCHDGWNGFGVAASGPNADQYVFGTTNHTTFNATTNCNGCHEFIVGKSNVGEMHNGQLTGRSGLLWGGKDQSIEEGKKIAMEITGVTRDDTVTPNRLAITWTAKNPATGALYNPCNTDQNAGPMFFNVTGANLSILRAYAQGNDWVNEGVGTAPGQPGAAVNVVAPNVDPLVFTNGQTTCSAENVATTLVNVETTTATRATVAIQGKPRVLFAGNNTVIAVRSPSPTREFVPATGAEPATKRRAIVDVKKCLACHQGSLYQHGGNRVDSVDLCVTCHNPASNDKNWRDTYGVTPDEAYDGRAGQTYDLRYMLHAIHSAGATSAPYVIYRGNNGIYAFGSQATIDDLAATKNWPGAGQQVVFGSSPAATRNHTEIVVHYPRPLGECNACHIDETGAVPLPSTREAVGVTASAGGTTYATQTDDVLWSPATASCMSCHQSADPVVQNALQSHAFQNSWVPGLFTGQRQTVLDGVVSESCALCHGTGGTWDYNAAHAAPAAAAAH
jgi:OmcA/MtrC family decaheme c-type cytochrome